MICLYSAGAGVVAVAHSYLKSLLEPDALSMMSHERIPVSAFRIKRI